MYLHKWLKISAPTNQVETVRTSLEIIVEIAGGEISEKSPLELSSRIGV